MYPGSPGTLGTPEHPRVYPGTLGLPGLPDTRRSRLCQGYRGHIRGPRVYPGYALRRRTTNGRSTASSQLARADEARGAQIAAALS